MAEDKNETDKKDEQQAAAANVLPAELSKEMRTSFLEYSMSVIVSRALPDVRDGVWYTGAVNWAVANGVMNGYADETGARTAFGPDDAVTMEQLLQTLANLKGASNADEAALSSLIDAENISPWARSAAAWAIQQGVVSGYELPDGTHQLVPGERIARERVAVVLSNALEKGIL